MSQKVTPADHASHVSSLVKRSLPAGSAQGSSGKGKGKKPSAVLPPRPEGDEDAGRYFDEIVLFMSGADDIMLFPSSLDGLQRKKVHAIAELFGLAHESVGERGHHTVSLKKVSPAELKGKSSIYRSREASETYIQPRKSKKPSSGRS